MSEWSRLARRPFLLGIGAAAGLSIVGGGIYESVEFLHRPRPPAGYEDLLSGLGDRVAVNRVGAAVLAQTGTFDVHAKARQLRHHIAGRTLVDVVEADIGQDRLVEAQGWVLPETLALLCGLSAKLG
jgi:hypothetical protein